MIFLISATAALISAGLTPLIAKIALRLGVVDDPAIQPARRLHTMPVPLLGGVAIWVTIVAGIVAYGFVGNSLNAGYIARRQLVGLLAGSTLLMIGGYLDDRYRLTPKRSIVFPILAVLVVIMSGVGVNFITNPLGGVWRIDGWKISLNVFSILPITFSVGSVCLTFAWLMGMMYTTKLLDGLDGLVSGITVIGAFTLAALSLTSAVHQPDTALLAALTAGAWLGFLVHNLAPARIFLGEGGALLAGYMIGTMAIIAGGKIATALLVIGVPALDVGWVIARRVLWERRSFALPDRKHLHFRLLDVGLTIRQTVAVFWLSSAIFGLAAILLQSRGKLVALLILASLMALGGLSLVLISTKRQRA